MGNFATGGDPDRVVRFWPNCFNLFWLAGFVSGALCGIAELNIILLNSSVFIMVFFMVAVMDLWLVLQSWLFWPNLFNMFWDVGVCV